MLISFFKSCRIPCQQDEVRFQSKATFKLQIDLDKRNYKLRNLFINNKKLISRDFERFYTNTKIGKLQFSITQLPFYITNNDDQTDHEVQLCQNNFNYFYNKICRNVIGKCSTQLNCSNAIRPIGFCCSICGSLIKINYFSNRDNKTSLKILNNDFIENTLANLNLDKYQQVNFFLSKITETSIEIILIDQALEEDETVRSRQSRSFANEIMNFFKKGK